MPTFDYEFTVNASLRAVRGFHRETSALKRLTPPGICAIPKQRLLANLSNNGAGLKARNRKVTAICSPPDRRTSDKCNLNRTREN